MTNALRDLRASAVKFSDPSRTHTFVNYAEHLALAPYPYSQTKALETAETRRTRSARPTGSPSGAQYTHPSGMLTEYEYDTQNRLTDIRHKDGTTIKQRFDYAFDANSNVAGVTHEDGSYWAYTYDGRDRLTLAIRYDDQSVEEYRETYTYDDGDNLVTKIVKRAGHNPVGTTYAVNDANELLSQTTGPNNITYTYDAAGRQASKYDGTYTTLNNWRYADMLYSIESDDPGVPDVTYLYGGNGLKRSRQTDTEYDWYNWSGLQLIQAEDDQGALTDTYVHHPFRIWGSTLADISDGTPSTGTARYYTHDMLGSTRGVWNGSKAQIGAWEPTPFGDTYTNTLPADILHRFTGQVYDPVTDLNYFAFRHYSPGQARWLSPEPFGIDGPNLYWYGLGNPSSVVDAFGLMGRGTKGGGYEECGHPTCGETKPLKMPQWLKDFLNSVLPDFLTGVAKGKAGDVLGGVTLLEGGAAALEGASIAVPHADRIKKMSGPNPPDIPLYSGEPGPVACQ